MNCSKVNLLRACIIKRDNALGANSISYIKETKRMMRIINDLALMEQDYVITKGKPHYSVQLSLLDYEGLIVLRESFDEIKSILGLSDLNDVDFMEYVQKVGALAREYSTLHHIKQSKRK